MSHQPASGAIERALLAAAKRVLRGRAAPLPDWRARPSRVLFLRHDKIGDMVMTTGVLRAIAESHPRLSLDVLASRSNAAVLEQLPFVHETLVLNGVVEGGSPWAAVRAAPALRARGYDAVVDGLVLNLTLTSVTATLLAACGAPRRIGLHSAYGGPRAGALAALTHLVDPPADPHANHVEYLACLAAAFGVAPADVPHPTLRLTDAEAAAAEQAWQGAARGSGAAAGGLRLLVNVSAGHPRRRWSDAQFVAAIRHARALPVAAATTSVVVVGDPGERAAVEAIAAEAGASAPPTASVRAAFALVAAADAVLTPDTAIAHVASTFRKPCVTLMLPGSEPFTPYRTPGEVVMSTAPEMTGVSGDAVAAALDRVLRLTASLNGCAEAGAGPGVGQGLQPALDA